MIEWDALITKSRELSMSGILGLVETDILYAEPGTEQPELWRILQAMVGIGCLRVVSRICKAPCWEFLHQMYGIEPPESVEAREFWLRQPSWTEMSRLGMTQEDTSYHRINQGSGPQLRILWTSRELQDEHDWWNQSGDSLRHRDPSPGSPPEPPFVKRDSLAVMPLESSRPSRSASVSGRSMDRDALQRGQTPLIYVTRRGSSVSEGTTDKWFMDRWQCEVLAVASIHDLTIAEASEVLTITYFGHQTGLGWHAGLGLACTILSAGTFATAELTDWSWTLQFTALSCLGYFVNRTASLRGWKFDPNLALRDVRPRLLPKWPSAEAGMLYVRIAVQSSGFCHLRGLVSFRVEDLNKARDIARTKRGRWSSLRRQIRYTVPYADENPKEGNEVNHWLSYEVQSSWYGLVSTVEADNRAVRSLSVVLILVNGLILLVLGFGSTIKEGWNGIVLGIYVAGIIIAILARNRNAQWTMPEFETIDLTSKRLPPTVKHRLKKAKAPIFIEETGEEIEELITVENSMEKGKAVSLAVQSTG